MSQQIHMVLRSLVFLLLCFICVFHTLAQNQNSSEPTAGSVKVDPPIVIEDHEQTVAFWTTESGWKSELQLRNNLAAQDLTVTPALRLANGAQTNLAAVTIKPQEVKSVDLETAIAAAAAPQLVGTRGSLVLRYRSSGDRNLYAALMVRNIGHPFAFHIDAVGESQEYQSGGREGVWWLPTDTAKDDLIVTNQGKNTIQATLSLYDAIGRESKQKVLLGPHETTRYSVRSLLQAAQLTGSYGGIQISAPSHAGSLDTLHFIYDEKAAFSAILKMFDHNPNSKLEERDFAKTGAWTLRAPMLALSNPDPALAFPPGTALQPQLFLRNTTVKSVDASIRFGSKAATSLRLNPNETRRVDVSAFEDGSTIPKQSHWTPVAIITKGLPDELVAVAASYDSTLRYGAQTPFSDQLSFRWGGGMWEYDPYHNSIITAGNGGTKPTKAAFTIFYNQGAEKYELEQTLKPDEQMWIDVGKLIREHLPDKNGKTLPADLTMGSYEFRDLTNVPLGSLFEGKVITDKTYGHVSYGCAGCCGNGSAYLTYNPLGIPFLSGAGNGVNASDNCGGVDNVSSSFFGNWSTASTSIATVDYYATHSAVAVGSTSSSTYGYLPHTLRYSCPLYQQGASGGDNTRPSVAIQGNPTHVYIGSDSTVIQNNRLFSQGTPSGGTYTWSTPDSTTSFDNVNAQDPHVKATNYTGKTNDTQLTVNYSYNGVAATPASVMVTKLIFERLCCDSVTQVASYNGPTQYGYIFQASYNVIANPGSVQVRDGSGVSTSEQVTQTSSNNPVNPHTGAGALTANPSNYLLDGLSLLNSTPLPSNLNIVDSQNWFVGGFYVRNNTLTWTSTRVTVTNNGPTS